MNSSTRMQVQWLPKRKLVKSLQVVHTPILLKTLRFKDQPAVMLLLEGLRNFTFY